MIRKAIIDTSTRDQGHVQDTPYDVVHHCCAWPKCNTSWVRCSEMFGPVMSPCARTVTRRRDPARVTCHVIRSILTPDQPYSNSQVRTGSKLLRMESSAFTVRAASPMPRKHRTTTATRRRLRTHRNGRRCRDSATNSTNRSALDGSSCYSVHGGTRELGTYGRSYQTTSCCHQPGSCTRSTRLERS